MKAPQHEPASPDQRRDVCPHAGGSPSSFPRPIHRSGAHCRISARTGESSASTVAESWSNAAFFGSSSATERWEVMLSAYSSTSFGLTRPRFAMRSEEHTSELQSLMRISYAVFCLKKKIYRTQIRTTTNTINNTQTT